MKREYHFAELSLNIGAFASFLAIEPEHTNLELLQYGADIDIYSTKKALVPFSNRLSVLAGPSHTVTAPAATPATIARLIEALRQLAQVVILDVPSTCDESQLATLNSADQVVLVAGHTVPSIHMAAEALQRGLRAHSPWVVINRFDAAAPGLEVGQIKSILAIDSLRPLVLDHAAVNGSVNRGQPLRTSLSQARSRSRVQPGSTHSHYEGLASSIRPWFKTRRFWPAFRVIRRRLVSSCGWGQFTRNCVQEFVWRQFVEALQRAVDRLNLFEVFIVLNKVFNHPIAGLDQFIV